jgi:hypothetical protein
VSYPTDQVYREMAFLGRHVHWTFNELLMLDHVERLRWVREVSTVVDSRETRTAVET